MKTKVVFSDTYSYFTFGTEPANQGGAEWFTVMEIANMTWSKDLSSAFKRMCACCALMLVCLSGWSQAPISELRLKKFPTDPGEIYPYYSRTRNKPFQLVEHDPVIACEDGSFVMLWRKDFSPFHRRFLTRYNILTEEVWSEEINLNRNEDVIDFFQQDSLAILLTYTYRFPKGQHVITARTYSLIDGKAGDTRILWNGDGKNAYELQVGYSPNKQYRILYQVLNTKGLSPYTQMEYANFQGELARIVSRGEALAICVFSANLEIQWTDTLDLIGQKTSLLGVDIDNKGSVYTSYYHRKTQDLTIVQHRPEKTPVRLETQTDLPWKDLSDPYATLLPLKVGAADHIYMAYASRVIKGKLRGTKGFTILDFDFQQGVVNDSRYGEISSSLIVKVEKSRVGFNLKPLKRFEHYVLQDLLILPDQTLWLVIQHYETTVGVRAFENMSSRIEEEKYEDLIFIEYDDKGATGNAITVPTLQELAYPLEYLAFPPLLQLDTLQQRICLITREPAGEKLRDPERPFIRYIDLKDGTYTPRKQLYEAKRRYQFLPTAYLQWLNPELLTMMVIDGDRGNAYLVTINTVADPPAEEEK